MLPGAVTKAFDATYLARAEPRLVGLLTAWPLTANMCSHMMMRSRFPPGDSSRREQPMSRPSPLVDELTAVVDRMVAAGPSSLADAETVLGLHRQLDRLGAVNTRATAAFDASRAWADDGARSAAAWLATRAQLPPATARRRMRVGRALRSMGIVEGAWLAGDIGDAQVGLLANAHTPATAEVFARDEQALVDDAIRLRFGDFSRVLWYWSYHADADGAEDRATRDHASRRLHLSQSYRGMWFGDFALDAISGAIVSDGLKRIEGSPPTGPRPAAAWAPIPPSSTCVAPPPNGGPTPWSRWPPARPAHLPTAVAPSRCSPCSWATRPLRG